MEIKGIEVTGDERVGEGGYLRLRRMRMRLLLSDGSRTAEGTWDYVERPMGLDAVVVALFRRREGTVEVLLRHGIRVPIQFGRAERPAALLFPELVAGILEPGDELFQRAAAEAMEEAGLRVPPSSVRILGPAAFPTPGMCAELFHFVCCEVPADVVAHLPAGDGSPFEEGARLEWAPLDDALARCARGEIRDLKTEIGVRRLRDRAGREARHQAHLVGQRPVDGAPVGDLGAGASSGRRREPLHQRDLALQLVDAPLFGLAFRAVDRVDLLVADPDDDALQRPAALRVHPERHGRAGAQRCPKQVVRGPRSVPTSTGSSETRLWRPDLDLLGKPGSAGDGDVHVLDIAALDAR